MYAMLVPMYVKTKQKGNVERAQINNSIILTGFIFLRILTAPPPSLLLHPALYFHPAASLADENRKILRVTSRVPPVDWIWHHQQLKIQKYVT